MDLNIDPQVERDLTALADMQNISVNTLLREFTNQKKRYWAERAEDMERLAAAKQDSCMSHEDMKDHFQALRAKAQTRL